LLAEQEQLQKLMTAYDVIQDIDDDIDDEIVMVSPFEYSRPLAWGV